MIDTMNLKWGASFVALLLCSALGCAGSETDGRVLTRDDAGTTGDSGTMDDGDVATANNDGNNSVDTDAGDAGIETDTDRPDGGVCQPDFDGRITRDEVTLRPGLSAKFKVATDVMVDVEGTIVDGVRTWDFSGDLPGDMLELIELRDPDQLWFGDAFPTATYAAKLSAEGDLLGVFEATDDALLLAGLVSPEESLFSTELEYDPPVEVLSFPIEQGATWSGTHDVTGTAQGAFAVYDEEYVSEVWAEGTLDIPFGSFEVQVIRVELTRTVGLLETKIRTYAFVSECFGTVATVRSQDNEDAIFFDEAAEIRRLAP